MEISNPLFLPDDSVTNAKVVALGRAVFLTTSAPFIAEKSGPHLITISSAGSGGGAGGGVTGDAVGMGFGGRGGLSGTVVRGIYNLVAGTSYPVTLGSAGLGGLGVLGAAGNQGGEGGASYIGALIYAATRSGGFGGGVGTLNVYAADDLATGYSGSGENAGAGASPPNFDSDGRLGDSPDWYGGSGGGGSGALGGGSGTAYVGGTGGVGWGGWCLIQW